MHRHQKSVTLTLKHTFCIDVKIHYHTSHTIIIFNTTVMFYTAYIKNFDSYTDYNLIHCI